MIGKFFLFRNYVELINKFLVGGQFWQTGQVSTPPMSDKHGVSLFKPELQVI